jgi:hypothetical protein
VNLRIFLGIVIAYHSKHHLPISHTKSIKMRDDNLSWYQQAFMCGRKGKDKNLKENPSNRYRCQSKRDRGYRMTFLKLALKGFLHKKL